MHVCDYGCGNEATHQLKCGKWCCSESINKCPGMRMKNSAGCRNYSKTHKRKSSRGMRGKTAWNKGKTADTNSIVRATAEKVSQTLKGRKGHAQTEDTKAKISKTMRTLGFGGLREGAGRGKKGFYKGIWCDSTWELAYVIYNIDHNIAFKRNYESFAYTYDGVKRSYYPDFILSTGQYVEVKGYYTEQFKEKVRQFPKNHDLIVYDKTTIAPYLKYAIETYGKDFYTLYDKK